MINIVHKLQLPYVKPFLITTWQQNKSKTSDWWSPKMLIEENCFINIFLLCWRSSFQRHFGLDRIKEILTLVYMSFKYLQIRFSSRPRICAFRVQISSSYFISFRSFKPLADRQIDGRTDADSIARSIEFLFNPMGGTLK